MKATGIVRRIDDLGRVVIPKEIRRTLNIKEGDPLEIYIDHERDEIIFHKYQPETENIASECAKMVASAIKNKYVVGIFVNGDEVEICTPRGTATAKRNAQDAFDLNVGIVAALSKLGYCKMPDGLGN